ncbi:MAG: SusE domain-containing protein [Prevotellaceae bacterium]|nr:SusE domain-containing protein [Prevotellaceae bacterium]
MKHIICLAVCTLLVCSCTEKYEYNTDFTAPTSLVSPASVTLDLTSSANVILEWNGGGAADGSIVQYEVVFAAGSGNFDTPVETMQSDLGALPKLTLTHAQLNSIARRAGIASASTGDIKWTVNSSKGGVVKSVDISKTISVTRGEGIDIPPSLYLYGTGTNATDETEGRQFREAEEGVFCIYTNLANGSVHFQSATVPAESTQYYYDGTKLKEGNGEMNVTATAGHTARITVNFNTLSVTVETIANVRCIWGATFDVIGNIAYVGSGIFKADNCPVRFIDPNKPETNPPSWLSWIEERYYFIATVNGGDKCWGRMDGISSERPVGGEPLSFYELGEFTWDQWEHLWKMSGSLDMKKCTITINTNLEGLMVHQFSNITNI